MAEYTDVTLSIPTKWIKYLKELAGDNVTIEQMKAWAVDELIKQARGVVELKLGSIMEGKTDDEKIAIVEG